MPEPKHREWSAEEVQQDIFTNGYEEIDNIELSTLTGDRHNETKTVHFDQNSIIGVIQTIFMSKSNRSMKKFERCFKRWINSDR